MSKITTNIVSNEELNSIISETLGFLADTLSNTLGPYGTSTIMQDAHLRHTVSKDGYSLLKKIFIKEEVPRTVLDMVKGISRNLVRKVGDGSTSSIIVANKLYNEIQGIIEKNNVPMKDIIDILNQLSELLAKEVYDSATTLDVDSVQLKQIAAVSTNNDMNYGELIQEVFTKIGRYGFITLEKSKSPKTYYEITKGFEIPRGYIDMRMANMPDGKSVELINPYVFMCDEMINGDDMEIIGQMMGRICLQEGTPLVIIAKSYDTQMHTFFQSNMIRSNLPLLVVELATESRDSKNRFDDLALSLGCTPYKKSEGELMTEFSDVAFERLGRSLKVVGNELNTQFIKGNGDEKLISARIDKLTEEIGEMERNETYIEFDNDIYNLRKRISTLSNSMAVLHVGGNSEEEKESVKFLVEDAVFACRSALKHGYVVGGNLIIPSLINDKKDEILSTITSKHKGLVQSLLESIYSSFSNSYATVLDNAYKDKDRSDNVVQNCITNKTIVNLKNDVTEPFETTSIINSAQTDAEILKSAVSIIGLLATSNQFIRLNV